MTKIIALIIGILIFLAVVTHGAAWLICGFRTAICKRPENAALFRRLWLVLFIIGIVVSSIFLGVLGHALYINNFESTAQMDRIRQELTAVNVRFADAKDFLGLSKVRAGANEDIEIYVPQKCAGYAAGSAEPNRCFAVKVRPVVCSRLAMLDWGDNLMDLIINGRSALAPGSKHASIATAIRLCENTPKEHCTIILVFKK